MSSKNIKRLYGWKNMPVLQQKELKIKKDFPITEKIAIYFFLFTITNLLLSLII